MPQINLIPEGERVKIPVFEITAGLLIIFFIGYAVIFLSSQKSELHHLEERIQALKTTEMNLPVEEYRLLKKMEKIYTSYESLTAVAETSKLSAKPLNQVTQLAGEDLDITRINFNGPNKLYIHASFADMTSGANYLELLEAQVGIMKTEINSLRLTMNKRYAADIKVFLD